MMHDRVERRGDGTDLEKQLAWVRSTSLIVARGYLRAVADRDGVAEEVAQEVTIEVARLADRGALRGDEVRRVTWSIARRRAIDRRRRAVRKGNARVRVAREFAAIDPIATLATAGASPSSLAGRRELYNALLDESAALPARQRHALLLYFVAGLTTTEIGRTLGLSRTAAANQVRRATLALRARWRQRVTGSELDTPEPRTDR